MQITQRSSRLRSFAPIADRGARVLILGSMPGVASLRAKQYYAHPQNQFWRILSALLSLPVDLPYAKRVEALKTHGIALWDVLRSCERVGSLDSAIREEEPNDFARFFGKHSRIERVLFNGAKAEAIFRHHGLAEKFAHLKYTRLPSTSPAHAGMNLQTKQAAWATAIFPR